MNDEVVDHGCEDIAEQDREHNALRKGRIDDSNDEGHEADQEPVDPFPGIRLARGNRVSGHEHSTEGETANNVRG